MKKVILSEVETSVIRVDYLHNDHLIAARSIGSKKIIGFITQATDEDQNYFIVNTSGDELTRDYSSIKDLIKQESISYTFEVID